MIYVAACRKGPYNEKVEQDVVDHTGRIVAFGYDTKWIDPVALDAIESGEIAKGSNVWICAMTLGDNLAPIELRRESEIQYIKNYDNAYVRLNLRLLEGADSGQLYPPEGKEGFLFGILEE